MLDLIVKNCSSNAAMQLSLIDKEGKERQTTILFNTEDPWSVSPLINSLNDLFDFFATGVIKEALLDESVVLVRANVFQIKDGELDLIIKYNTMHKDEGTFKAIEINKDGSVSLS